jgi:hypothetical protein
MSDEIRTQIDKAQEKMGAAIIAALRDFTNETGLAVDAVAFNTDRAWITGEQPVIEYSRFRACLSSNRI